MHNVAILGYRAQGSRHHAPSYARLHNCRIAAVCDIVEERAQQGADTYGVPAYTCAEEMLDREAIDIVDIPTGEQYRLELVMNALGRGKHVFTEKPLAAAEGQYRIRLSDIPAARQMVDAWQQQGTHFGICFCLHGSANVRRAIDVIQSGVLGELCQVQARTAQGSWNHIVDLLRFLGGDIAEVAAYAGAEGMDNKVVCLQYTSGAVATLAVSRELSLQFQIKWIGSLGEITIDNIAGTASWQMHDSLDTVQWSDATRLDQGTYDSLFHNHIADFVDAIDRNRPFVADGWAGLRHIEIDAAITEAIVTGSPVAVHRYRPKHGQTIHTLRKGAPSG